MVGTANPARTVNQGQMEYQAKMQRPVRQSRTFAMIVIRQVRDHREDRAAKGQMDLPESEDWIRMAANGDRMAFPVLQGHRVTLDLPDRLVQKALMERRTRKSDHPGHLDHQGRLEHPVSMDHWAHMANRDHLVTPVQLALPAHPVLPADQGRPEIRVPAVLGAPLVVVHIAHHRAHRRGIVCRRLIKLLCVLYVTICLVLNAN